MFVQKILETKEMNYISSSLCFIHTQNEDKHKNLIICF